MCENGCYGLTLLGLWAVLFVVLCYVCSCVVCCVCGARLLSVVRVFACCLWGVSMCCLLCVFLFVFVLSDFCVRLLACVFACCLWWLWSCAVCGGWLAAEWAVVVDGWREAVGECWVVVGEWVGGW